MFMCTKFTVAYGDFIGSRMVGWCVFNGKDYSFISDKTVKTKLQQGVLVNGLMLDADGNVVIDTNFTTNLMAKSGLTFKPMIEAEEEEVSIMNKYYALVRVTQTETETTYHFITNRCGCEVFTENKLKSLLEVMDFGGVRLSSDDNLEIHKGVDVVDSRTSQNKPRGEEKPIAAVEKPVADVKKTVTDTKPVADVKQPVADTKPVTQDKKSDDGKAKSADKKSDDDKAKSADKKDKGVK